MAYKKFQNNQPVTLMIVQNLKGDKNSRMPFYVSKSVDFGDYHFEVEFDKDLKTNSLSPKSRKLQDLGNLGNGISNALNKYGEILPSRASKSKSDSKNYDIKHAYSGENL